MADKAATKMPIDQVSDTFEDELHAIQEGLRLTEHARSITDNSDHRRLPLLIQRLSTLQFQDRLRTFLHLSNNQYIPSAYLQFRSTPLTHIAYTFAAAGNMGALAVLLSRHPFSIAPHLLNILDAAPDTLDAAEYQRILSTLEFITSSSTGKIHIERSADWAEDRDVLQSIITSTTTHHERSGIELPETEYTSKFLKNEDKKTTILIPTWLQVAVWIEEKAVAIDKNSGQLVKSIELLQLGMEVVIKYVGYDSVRQLGDMLVAAQQLAIVLSVAATIIEDIQNEEEDEDDGRSSKNVIPKAGEDDVLVQQQKAFIMSAALEEFAQLGQQERLEILLNVLETGAPPSKREQQVLLAFSSLAIREGEGEEGTSSASLLLVKSLINRVETNMSQVVALSSLEATEPVALNSPELVCSFALQCIDACTDMDTNNWLQQLIQAARQAAWLSSSQNLEDAVEQTAQRIKAAHALTQQGLQCTPGQLAPMDSQQAQQIITSLLVNIQNSREARHNPDAWLELWETIQFVQQHGFKEGILSKEVIHTEVCRAMLKSGQCELAAEHVLPGLSAEVADKVVLSTAKSIFTSTGQTANSSKSSSSFKALVTPTAEREIRECLALLLSSPAPPLHQYHNTKHTSAAAQAVLQALDAAIELQSLGVHDLDVSRLIPSSVENRDETAEEQLYDRDILLEDILASQPELSADMDTMTALADALGVSGDRAGLLMRAVEAGLASGQLSAAQRSALALVQMNYNSRRKELVDGQREGDVNDKEGMKDSMQKRIQERSRTWELVARVALDSRCHDAEVKRQLLGFAALNAPPSEALDLLKSWREQDEMICQKQALPNNSGAVRFWPSFSTTGGDQSKETCRLALHQYFEKATINAAGRSATLLSETLALGSLLTLGPSGLTFWDQLLDHYTPQLSYDGLKRALELGLSCAAIMALHHKSNTASSTNSDGEAQNNYLEMPVEMLEQLATENAAASDENCAVVARQGVVRYRKMLTDAADAFKLETLLAKNNIGSTATTEQLQQQQQQSSASLITASSASRRDAVYDLVTSAAKQVDISQGQSMMSDALSLGSRHDIAASDLHLHYLKCFLTNQWGGERLHADAIQQVVQGSLEVVLDHVPESTVDMLVSSILPLFITNKPSTESLNLCLSSIVSSCRVLAGSHNGEGSSSTSWKQLESILPELQTAISDNSTASLHGIIKTVLFLSPVLPMLTSAVSNLTSNHQHQTHDAIPTKKDLLQEIGQFISQTAAAAKDTDALASWVGQLHSVFSQLAQLSATQGLGGATYPVASSQVYTAALCHLIMQEKLDTSLLQHYIQGMSVEDIIKTMTWASLDGSTIPLVNMNVHQLPRLDEDAQIQLLDTALAHLQSRQESGDEMVEQQQCVAMWQLQRECLRLKASNFIRDRCGASLSEKEAEDIQETLAIMSEFGFDSKINNNSGDTRGEVAFERCLKGLLTTGCDMHNIFSIASALLIMQGNSNGGADKAPQVAVGRIVTSAIKEALSAFTTACTSNSGMLSIGDAIQNLYGILRSLDNDSSDDYNGDDVVVVEINKLRVNVWKFLRQHAAGHSEGALDAASAEAHLQVVEMLGMLGNSMWQGWSPPTAAATTTGRSSGRRRSTDKQTPTAVAVPPPGIPTNDDNDKKSVEVNSSANTESAPPVVAEQAMEENKPEEEDFLNDDEQLILEEDEEREEEEEEEEEEALPSGEYSHIETVLFARIVASLSSSGWAGAARQASITASDFSTTDTTQSAVLRLIDAAESSDHLRAIITVLSNVLDGSLTFAGIEDSKEEGEVISLHSCWFACLSSLLEHGDLSTVLNIIDCHPKCLIKEEVDSIIYRGDSSHGAAAAVALWAVSHLGQASLTPTITPSRIPASMWDRFKQAVLQGSAYNLPGMQLALIAAVLTDQLPELILTGDPRVFCCHFLPCLLNAPTSRNISSTQIPSVFWSQLWSEKVKISPRSAVAGLLVSELVRRRAYTVAAAVAMEHSGLHPMLRIIDSGMRSVRDLLKACSKVRVDGDDDCREGVVMVPEGIELEAPRVLAAVISKVPDASATALDELLSIVT